MTAHNDITGDAIKSRVNNKQFEDNFDAIFRKQPPVKNDDWNEDRIDIIGQNGPTGDHYKGE